MTAAHRAARRLLHPLVPGLETGVHPLRCLFVEITQRCNLKCLHCGNDCGTRPQLDELTTDQWIRFLGYLRRNSNGTSCCTFERADGATQGG